VGRVARLIPVLAVVAVPFAGAASPPQVAFKELPGMHYGIVRFDQTGGNAVELTRGQPEPGVSGAFSWSPDGSRLVYANEGVLDGDLYTLDADGGSLARLTTGGGNRDAVWSPDGGRIAYVHSVQVKQPNGITRLDEEIWLVAPDGGNAHQLTYDAGEKYRPEWSPNGSRILYSRLDTRVKWGTFVVDADTGRVLLHTGDAGGTWSPDGSHIAVDTGDGIDVLNADGTGRHMVAADGAQGPAWSPDGTRIAFGRSHCTPGLKGLCGAILGSVFSVGADGRGERRLTGPIAGGPTSLYGGFLFDESSGATWWPDRSQLFFFEQRDQPYVMNADGTCEHPFSREYLMVEAPSWRPGAKPSLPPLRCVDLRPRSAPFRYAIGRRDDGRVHVTIENDGNETATGLTVTLRLSGSGRIRLPLPSCRRTPAIVCDLAPLAPGATTHFAVTVTHPRPYSFSLYASAAARETDSDPRTNSTRSDVYVMQCDVLGTYGADRLVGTPGRDTICGLPGPDVIHAGAGNDTILAGAGNDTIYPGPGRDVVDAGEGRDVIYARDGEHDVIDCGPYRDTVYADRIDKLSHCERVFLR